MVFGGNRVEMNKEIKNHLITYDCKICNDTLICEGCDRDRHEICMRCLGIENGINIRSKYTDTFDLNEALR